MLIAYLLYDSTYNVIIWSWLEKKYLHWPIQLCTSIPQRGCSLMIIHNSGKGLSVCMHILACYLP